MKYKQLHDGRQLPVLGLGTAHLRPEGYVDAVRAALDMGYTLIDTAEIYGGGRSEELIGKAIQGFDRDKLFITSKVAKHHLRKPQVMDAIEGSLRRLNTPYLDLYLIHAPDPGVPLEETFEALNDLVAMGKTKYIGVSNFSRAQTEQAFRLTASLLATNQVHYNLMHRGPERNGVLEFCQQSDVLLTAYSPLEEGELIDGHDEIKREALKHGATQAQIGIAWLINKPQVITIVESEDKEHLKENLGALDLQLSEEDMAKLDGLA